MATGAWHCVNGGCDFRIKIVMSTDEAVDRLLTIAETEHLAMCECPLGVGDGRLDPLLVEAAKQRRSRGRSQASVARATGASQSAISEMETGLTSPTLRVLRRYLSALGLDLQLVESSEGAG